MTPAFPERTKMLTKPLGLVAGWYHPGKVIAFLFIFWSLLLFSCKEVTFKEPQPQGVAPLKEIPASLFGKYLPHQAPPEDQADTLIIESWGYHFRDSNDKDWLGRGVLSDSLVVKFYQDYYFVNFKTGDQWVLRLVRQSPQWIEFLSIDLQNDEKGKNILKKLGQKIKVKEIKQGDDTFYQINPTPAQLMTLIKEGYFTGITLDRKK